MKKIESNIDSTNGIVEDAQVVTSQRGLLKRYRAWLATLVAIAIVGGSWAANRFYLEPKQDAAIVSKALQQLESTELGKAQVAAIVKRNSSDRLALTFLVLAPISGDAENSVKVDGYLAALRIAMRAGIPEAKLSYGVALRDGLIGPRDSAAALKVFDEVAREMEAGVRAGDPVAMYVTAWMLKEGFGKQPVQKDAIELAKRAVANLDGWRLESAGYDLVRGLFNGSFKPFFNSEIAYSRDVFSGHPHPELTASVASRLIDQKMESGPDIGSFSCVDPDPLKSVTCRKSWFERGVSAGMERYTLDYAKSMLKTNESLENIEKMFARSGGLGGPYDRYLHAVIRSMLATDDQQLMKALSDMWMQVTLHTELPDEYSLKFGTSAIGEFYTAVVNSGWEFTALGKPVPLSRKDKFLIAANVRGILMGREKWMEMEILSEFSDRPDIAKRFQSPEILRKSKIAAQAIRDGVPLNEVVLGNVIPKDVVTHANFFDQFDGKPTKSVDKRKPADSRSQEPLADREQQDKTGYLKGAPRAAVGGLSTFTVDNRQGGRDAVARIYLNGNKPAVRSMYVKQGETFKAEAILPGTYVFRYRFIGSEDTYESDKDFPLTQTETDTGTRFSNVSVTLFKVKDGNMSTRKVAPGDF